MAPSPAGMAQTMLNTVVLVFTLLAGLVVFLRLFTRGLLLHKADAEDVWILFALVLSIGLTVTIALQVQNGLGLHIQDLTPAMMTDSLKAFWASVWIYNLSLTATKISILTQYLRVFPTPRFRTACFVVMGVVVVYGLWTLLGSIFLCFPVAFFWDKSVSNGQCLDQKAVWFTNAGVNIAQDVVILFLPMTVVKTLSIPKKQKRALIVVFGIGSLVCLVSIIRLQTLVAVSNSTDPTFDNPPAAMLSAIETNVGIICACLPSMRPLLASMMPSFFGECSQHTNTSTWKHDAEQPKHTRYLSASDCPFTANSSKQTDPSRSGSASSQPYTHPRSDSRSQSRPGSRIYTPTTPIHSQSNLTTHSRTGSRSAHSRDPSISSRLAMRPVELQPLTPPPLNLSNGHQHPINPLRMSPIIPRLPRLPENMALLSPLVSRPGTSDSGLQGRRARTPLYHKPLPITPLPGHQNVPMYLTSAKDQAMLPIQLSPGLVPAPLGVVGKAPRNFRF